MSEGALECNVLVLNRFYMAIRVINVRRAMTLLYRGCAEVITIDAGVYTSYEFDAWCNCRNSMLSKNSPTKITSARFSSIFRCHASYD